MTTSKITYRDAVEYAISHIPDDVPQEILDKLGALIASLDKKASASKKPTAKQTENDAVRVALVEYIEDNAGDTAEGGFTVSDLIKVCPTVEGKSNQYVSAILRQAFLAGEIDKVTTKRHTYFIPKTGED